MVLMAAKFAGKCKRCGRAIAPGSQMDWTKEGGARHLTVEECDAAVHAPKLDRRVRGPQLELPEERLRAVHLLLAHPWKFAKSMPKMPHEYTLRRHWLNDDDFIWVVEFIRRVGYQERFIGRIWTYYDVGVHQYWDYGTGDPRATDEATRTILINRAVRKGEMAEPTLFV